MPAGAPGIVALGFSILMVPNFAFECKKNLAYVFKIVDQCGIT
jgi:hypothetical protein